MGFGFLGPQFPAHMLRKEALFSLLHIVQCAEFDLPAMCIKIPSVFFVRGGWDSVLYLVKFACVSKTSVCVAVQKGHFIVSSPNKRWSNKIIRK